MFESARRDGVLQLAATDTRWLSTGWDGGFVRADAAYAITVPDGWDRTDLDAYIHDRRRQAGFTRPGPSLLTGVDLEHGRGARTGPVEVYATAGLSNPAALPLDPPIEHGADGSAGDQQRIGTVNVVVGTTRALDDAAMANLVAVTAEAKAATLLAETGFPGTTSDAVIVACRPDGEPAQFTGSATPVGAAARACVRDAVRASLSARYPERSFPATVDDAKYGVVTTQETAVFRI